MEHTEQTIFWTRHDIVNHLKRTYQRLGYALTMKRSVANRYVYLRCDRGGIYSTRLELTAESKRGSTSSRLINCPFEVRRKICNGIWTFNVTNNAHNHGPSSGISGHPSTSRLNVAQREEVHRLACGRVSTRQIVSTLGQQDPDGYASPRAGSNERRRQVRPN